MTTFNKNPTDNTKSFQEKSYNLHEKHYSDYASGGSMEEHAKSWMDKTTVDAWRHRRMYRTLDPILLTESNSRWLTVGDGRYGSDANYILEKGVEVIATDISDTLLVESTKEGFISKYKKENAEALSFDNNEFDYVLCKESYHHFPRPMLALYEMLRVANKGIVLIEPNDVFIYNKASIIFFNYFKLIIKKLLRIPHVKHDFESSGNYKYSISRREIEKVTLGLDYRVIAFKGMNDAFYQGVHLEKVSENGPLLKKLKRIISCQNFLCQLGLTDYNIITAIILKQKPSDELMEKLIKDKFEVILLPKNPFINT